jgi:hypothetical protein
MPLQDTVALLELEAAVRRAAPELARALLACPVFLSTQLKLLTTI